MAILLRTAALAAALLVLLMPHAQAQRLPRGSYLQTCPEASVYRGRLTAVCRQRDGSFRQSQLPDVDRCVGDIANVDGRLRCHYGAGAPFPGGPARPLPGGSYQQSCSNIGLNGNTLVASCKAMNGRMQRTSLANVNRCVGDIGNNNGQLNCNMR
ncbi:MAG TPA: CVNH domain-containing protein [Stellaceae bacterium]|jgi:hypothetical protein